MKEEGVILIFRTCAVPAWATVIIFSAAGCLQVMGYADRKDPIPLRDAGEDMGDGADEDGEGEDLFPDDVHTEDIAGDEPQEDAELPDMPEGEDFPDIPGDPDVEDRIEGEDVPLDPDVPDEPELPPGLVWVWIPAGSFDMGCSPGDADCDVNEEPSHTVNVSAFRMTETEITQAQYELVMGETPSYFTSCGASCPVEQVTWHEAKAFCEAIGGRLPSEAEWEYAARAGTTTRYYCGDDSACLDAVAWYADNSGDTTHPVAEKTANAFGLYDMLGNVWEWVEDCWHADYTDAPSSGDVWSGGDCSRRVLRGGSWYYYMGDLRVSYRNRNNPDYRHWSRGFRCAQ